MIAQMPQITPLGEVWSYSNSGVCLAGRVIEVVTQRPFEQAIRELVLDPLQMSRSFFSFGDMITRRVAIGHVVVDNVPRVVARWVDRRWRRPSVGLASSLSDLLRFARFHLSCGTAPDGSRVLSPDSIRLMHSPLTPDRAPARAIGLTWFIDEISGTRTVSLLGSTAGISCQFLMVPERSFAVIALANIAGHAFDREVTAWALGHYLGLAEEIIPLDLPAGVLAGYAGHYVSPYGRLKLDVGDNGLVLHPIESDTGVAVPEGRPPRDREPLRLAFYHQDRVVVLGPRRIGVRGQFLRDSEGRIVWFRYPTVLWGRQP
jgi:CubicO group peptidase (beta-lactamase class C family)